MQASLFLASECKKLIISIWHSLALVSLESLERVWALVGETWEGLIVATWSSIREDEGNILADFHRHSSVLDDVWRWSHHNGLELLITPE